MTRARWYGYIWAGWTGAMLWVSAACGGSPRPPGATPGQASAASREAPDEHGDEHGDERGDEHGDERGDERGMGVEPAPSGAPSQPPPRPSNPSAPSTPSPGAPSDASFAIEARLRVRRIQHGRSITFDDVRSGDSVMDGDRLQLSVRASRDAYLYLAFCSHHAGDPRYHGLSVFPESGGVRMIANQTVTVPGKAEIILDDKPGQEALYLIASRVELSHADAGLAGVIAAARQGRATVDCGAPLHSAAAVASKNDKPRRGGRRGSADSTPPPASGQARPPVPAAGTEAARPVVEIERGGEIAFQEGAQSGVEADLEGIAILRYALAHEPAPPPDRQAGAPGSP